MQPTIEWVETWFKKFNSQYFGNELPLPNLRISHARRRLGSFSHHRYATKRSPFKRTYTISISDYYEQTEYQLQCVLLHEMIHFYIAYKNMHDNSPHGAVFQSIMHTINSSGQWDITVSVSNKKLMPNNNRVASSHTYLVLYLLDTNKRHLITVVNPRYAKLIDRRIRHIRNIIEHRWYTSENDFFHSFPAVRSIRAKMVSSEELQHLLPSMTPFCL